MRQFIVTSHDVPMTPDFSLDDIAGGVGRLDVLCRYVNSAFFLSHDICEDIQVHLVSGDEYTVRFEGSELCRLNPDEYSTAALIRKALEKREEVIGYMPAESSLGVFIRWMGFETTLEEAISDATVVEPHEDGGPVAQVEPPESPLFALPDHHDFTNEEAELLAAAADEWARLGLEILRVDHSVTVAHNYLDTAGYSRYRVGIGGASWRLTVVRNHNR